MTRHTRWAGPLFDEHVCSLGYQVVDWLEEYTCHGPGDLIGEPVTFDAEIIDFIVECYRLDEQTGRRVYDETVLSRPKGRAKSEIAGQLAVAEALSDVVRFDGWDASGQPVGRGVKTPLIKCLATEESQAGNTFENVAFIATDWGGDSHPDIYGGISGSRKYQTASSIWLPKGGEIRACTSGNASKDGGKETFVVADETHLYVLPELKGMYGTVQRNLGKRKIAQPWLLQTSTAPRAGEMSVFEETYTAWRKGELGPAVLFDHREAKGRIDITDHDRTLTQLAQVYGAAAAWMDLEHVYRLMLNPRVCRDEAEAARYYLNRTIASRNAWIADDIIERQSNTTEVVAFGEAISMGFDGSLNDDSTVLYGSRMSDGFLFVIGMWEKPDGPDGEGWQVPDDEVDAAVDEAHDRYVVSRQYCDPHEWRNNIGRWARKHGENVVIEWETRRDIQMAAALDRLRVALIKAEVEMDGDPRAVTHFGNAYVRLKGGHSLVRKQHPDSSRKIDSVPSAALAYEARADAIAAGWSPPKPTYIDFGPGA